MNLRAQIIVTLEIGHNTHVEKLEQRIDSALKRNGLHVKGVEVDMVSMEPIEREKSK